MDNQKITFVIFTYNEAARIERVIKNFQSFGKILLADNNSTDGTIEIARKNGCEVFLRKEEYVFVENQQLVDQLYEVIDTEWIYWGFADEMLELDTLNEIKKVVLADKHDIITMDRKNYFYGQFCYDLFHARTYKMFKKGTLDFTNNVIHSTGTATVPKNKIYDLPDKYFIHHFISNTAKSYMNVINNYTESEVESYRRPKTSLIYFIFIVSKITIKSFFFNKGYKSGYAGLTLTQLMLFYSLIKDMKHYEKNNDLNRLSIENKNNRFRDNILKRF